MITTKFTPADYKRIRLLFSLLLVAIAGTILLFSYQRFSRDMKVAKHRAEWSLWRSDNCRLVGAIKPMMEKPSAYQGAFMHGKPGTWVCGRTTYTLPNSDVPPIGWSLPSTSRDEYYAEK